MAIEKRFTPTSRPLAIDQVDVSNDIELDTVIKHVLEAGNIIAQAERQEMIRKGIIDTRGNLLKTELPEDMQDGKDRDFGG